MPKIDRFTLLFSVNSFAAAMLALYIGFALVLPRPYWAMTTAYIISQPLAGAVRSKAVYRVLGTVLGAAAAVLLVPNLVNAPVLLCLARALWVGGCLAISLLDRSPRSYVLMDTTRARALLDQASAAPPIFESRRRAALYRLAPLTGKTPQEFPRAAKACASPPHLATPSPPWATGRPCCAVGPTCVRPSEAWPGPPPGSAWRPPPSIRTYRWAGALARQVSWPILASPPPIVGVLAR